MKERWIKFWRILFDYYVATLEFNYALYKATKAAREFNRAIKSLNLDR